MIYKEHVVFISYTIHVKQMAAEIFHIHAVHVTIQEGRFSRKTGMN